MLVSAFRSASVKCGSIWQAQGRACYGQKHHNRFSPRSSYRVIFAFQYISFLLLRAASSPHLCRTCMQSGLCKCSCTQACKTIWISRTTIRDGTRRIPHTLAHARPHMHARTKREIYFSAPLPFFSLSGLTQPLDLFPELTP